MWKQILSGLVFSVAIVDFWDRALTLEGAGSVYFGILSVIALIDTVLLIRDSFKESKE